MKSDVVIRRYEVRVAKRDDGKVKEKNSSALSGINTSTAAIGYEVRAHDSSGNCMQKVKFAPVQVLRLCTGRTAHRGSRGIPLFFHVHGNRWG
jgi:hypothetical protein